MQYETQGIFGYVLIVDVDNIYRGDILELIYQNSTDNF